MLRYKRCNYPLNTCPSHAGPSRETFCHSRGTAHGLCREHKAALRCSRAQEDFATVTQDSSPPPSKCAQSQAHFISLLRQPDTVHFPPVCTYPCTGTNMTASCGSQNLDNNTCVTSVSSLTSKTGHCICTIC